MDMDPTRIQLLVRRTGYLRTFIIEIENNATIKHLKDVICQKMKLNPMFIKMLITFLKPLLNENLKLSDYNIRHLSSLSVTYVITKELHFPLHVDFKGKIYTLYNMTKNDNIWDIKKRIAIKLSIKMEYQILKYHGTELKNNNDSLITYFIYQECTIKLIELEKFQIHIDVNGRGQYTLSKMIKTDKILKIKQHIKMKYLIPIRCQFLIYNGIKLENDSLQLMMYGINKESTLTLYLPTALRTVSGLFLDKMISIIHINNDYITPINNEVDKVNKSFLETMGHQIDQMNVFKINQNYQRDFKVYKSILSLMKNKTEGMLFHGTSYTKIANIIHNGFNRDYNMTSWYGKGTYFTNDASFAAEYCEKNVYYDYYAMLCCKVIIGESVQGREYMDNCELYNDNGKQYDSLVDNLDDPTIFVINRDYHAIPVYVIVFNYKAIDIEEEEDDDDDNSDDDEDDETYPNWDRIDEDYYEYDIFKNECNTDQFNGIWCYSGIKGPVFNFANSQKTFNLFCILNAIDADYVFQHGFNNSDRQYVMPTSFTFCKTVKKALQINDNGSDDNDNVKLFLCDVFLSKRQQQSLQSKDMVIIRNTQIHRIELVGCADINTNTLKTNVLNPWRIVIDTAPNWNTIITVNTKIYNIQNDLKPVAKRKTNHYLQNMKIKNQKCTKLYYNKINKYKHHRGYCRRGNWKK